MGTEVKGPGIALAPRVHGGQRQGRQHSVTVSYPGGAEVLSAVLLRPELNGSFPDQKSGFVLKPRGGHFCSLAP